MNVHINFGRHAGEVRDIAPEAALAMLEDGRASRPLEDLEVYEVPAAIVEEIENRESLLSRGGAEIAAQLLVRPEELVEVQPRRRSRR